ncbi:hypothetical protein T484DRAFT_1763661 [Baffinella frigidus]|nr:hypothetical protein T484DRAFT_1763661 [Cryptophyta sp. CCMP2293]
MADSTSSGSVSSLLSCVADKLQSYKMLQDESDFLLDETYPDSSASTEALKDPQPPSQSCIQRELRTEALTHTAAAAQATGAVEQPSTALFARSASLRAVPGAAGGTPSGGQDGGLDEAVLRRARSLPARTASTRSLGAGSSGGKEQPLWGTGTGQTPRQLIKTGFKWGSPKLVWMGCRGALKERRANRAADM